MNIIKEEKENLLIEINQYKDNIKKLENQIADPSSKDLLTELNNNNKKLKSDIIELNEQIAKEKAKYLEDMRRCKSKIEKLQKTIDDLNNSSLQNDNISKRLSDNIKQNEKEINIKDQEIERHKNSIKELTEKYESLSREKENNKKIMSEEQEKNSKEIENFNENIKKLNKDNDKLKHKILKLEEELLSKTNIIESNNKSIKEMKEVSIKKLLQKIASFSDGLSLYTAEKEKNRLLFNTIQVNLKIKPGNEGKYQSFLQSKANDTRRKEQK